MKVIVADYSGFCFGVKKAVSTAYDASTDKGRIFTYGPIIHNGTVVKELELKGVRQLELNDDLKENDTVIIRSHGVPKQVIDSLYNKKVNIIDATCPYVENIHKIVEEYYHKDYQIIIAGDPNHPEIQGVNGWCDDTAIIINLAEESKNIKVYGKICIVAQTTLNIYKWKEIVLSLLEKSRELVVFNTICNATAQRQKSAEELAKISDAVVVLGGYNSSNTKKLVEICSEHCTKTYHVENINELDTEKLQGVNILGITAGASTPDWIIKEAIDKMDNCENTTDEKVEQSSFIDEYEKTLIRLHTGDVVRGRIIYVNDDEATVDLGYKADGIITREELSFEGDISPRDILKPNDEIDVYVLKVNDGEGNVQLSKKRVDSEKSWEYVEGSYNNNSLLDVRVKQIVKGGVITEAKGVNIFIPASLMDVRFIDDLSEFLGKSLKVKIITVDQDKHRVVGSRKAVLEEELSIKRADLLNSIKEGDVLSGKVIRIADFGAFVDLGGIDGLIHLSELSWTRVKHPSDVLKTGDVVEVYVLLVDKEKGRISLSLKRTFPEPWENIEQRIHIGDIVEGKVVRIAPFGAFVELEKGVDGLLHISQISNTRVNKVEDVLEVGTVIKAKVMELNILDRKISLSIKEVAEEKNEHTDEQPVNIQEQDEVTIGDILNNKKNE